MAEVIATAVDTLKPSTFAKHGIEMGNQFRGFATVEATTTIDDGKIKGGKGSGYSGRITKYTRCQVILNPRLEGYEDAVNAQRAREHGDKPIDELEHFTPNPRSWGEHIEGTSFVRHTKKGTTTEKIYLETRVLRSLETHYCIDGQPVAKETAEALLHPPRESKRQKTKKPIIIRDYWVENLDCITWTSPDKIAYTLNIE
jgi:hypothetical protein